MYTLKRYKFHGKAVVDLVGFLFPAMGDQSYKALNYRYTRYL